ncbi:MAG TPA: creatininase family protein [Chthoniobacteraceae bacterium]|nr:creatininase family protein [Chthoniobacteraceae bacterium]
MSRAPYPKASGLLETMTIEELRAFAPEVMMIVLGSTEPHGPHLPYGTDTVIGGGITAEAVRLANAQGARVLRLPPLPFGNNVNFKAFPFACRLRVETLMAVLGDLVAMAVEEGVRKVVITNSHGGNTSTLQAALRGLYDRFQQEVFVSACGTPDLNGGVHKELFGDRSPHAGDYETSMVMHLAPEWVVDEARRPAAMNTPTLPALAEGPVAWIRPWHLLMPESYAGTPDTATAEKGKTFLEAAARGLSDYLVELSRAPWHPRFPYAPGQ